MNKELLECEEDNGVYDCKSIFAAMVRIMRMIKVKDIDKEKGFIVIKDFLKLVIEEHAHPFMPITFRLSSDGLEGIGYIDGEMYIGFSFESLDEIYERTGENTVLIDRVMMNRFLKSGKIAVEQE